jgi:hypothetical protein
MRRDDRAALLLVRTLARGNGQRKGFGNRLSTPEYHRTKFQEPPFPHPARVPRKAATCFARRVKLAL